MLKDLTRMKLKDKELTLKDIQTESVRMLSVIDKFCLDNNIQYSLGYGALIGAIRHKGFIPWDDDIDLIMTRPNYQRFVALFNKDSGIRNNDMKLFAPELRNSYYNISHICDMKRTRVRKYYQWTDEDTGIWIDVFPIDSLPGDGGGKLRSQSELCFNVCGSRVPFSTEFGYKRHLKIIGKRFLYGWRSREKEINRYIELINQVPRYGSTSMVCNIGSPYGIKDIHRKEIFEDYKRTTFESISISIISQYDEYLKNIYGNYMQLPPVAAQVRGHSDNKYFWR